MRIHPRWLIPVALLIAGIVVVIVGTGTADAVGGGTEAPILEVFLFVGLLFIIFNYALSRLSRRLEIREKERSGSKPDIEVRGLEEQVA